MNSNFCIDACSLVHTNTAHTAPRVYLTRRYAAQVLAGGIDLVEITRFREKLQKTMKNHFETLVLKLMIRVFRC